MRDLLIDKNKQELKQHGNVEFPFRIMENLLVIGIKK